ncbi:MAG: hypothetical protein IJ946_04480 [Clostridia bacterium]|nr:hypothetical protein [Clostridia bacterium]
MNTYKIADIVVAIDVKYGLLEGRAQPYLYNGKEKPVAQISVPDEVMEKARIKFEGLGDAELEYLLCGAMFYDVLHDYDGLMLHSSAVALDGRAYLFSANSGVGKSTHTALWLKAFPNAVILNDDKPAIRAVGGNLIVYGTPFSGKHDISVNRGYLLGGICFLSRGNENRIEEISVKEALPLFLAQSDGMKKEERVIKRLNVTDKVLSKARLYKMKCNMDISAAYTSYEKMKTAMPVTLSQLLPAIEEMLLNDMEVTFNTNGSSMLPLLRSGDSVTVKKAQAYKKGDVVLFKRDDEGFVLHRIVKIKGDTVYTEGDSLLTRDEPFEKERIIGKAVAFFRKGKKIKISDFKYKVYMLCYVSVFGKALRKIKRKIKRQ